MTRTARIALFAATVTGTTMVTAPVPAAAVTIPPRYACITTTTTVEQKGRTQIRTTVRVCGGRRYCTKVERILPQGKARTLLDTCAPGPRRPWPTAK